MASISEFQVLFAVTCCCAGCWGVAAVLNLYCLGWGAVFPGSLAVLTCQHQPSVSAARGGSRGIAGAQDSPCRCR